MEDIAIGYEAVCMVDWAKKMESGRFVRVYVGPICRVGPLV